MVSVGTDDPRLVIHDEPTAAAQMAYDERLAWAGVPTLRLFRWSAPSISLGYRQRCPEWIDPLRFAAQGVEVVERPTGGGLAIHGTDVSCSLVMPRVSGVPLRDLMEGLCERWARVCRGWDLDVQWEIECSSARPVVYCLTEPSPYALTVAGRKLCGFAIRAYDATWLIQGSLLVRPLPEAIQGLMPRPVREDYEARAVCLEEAAGVPIDDADLTKRVMGAWERDDAVRYL